MNSSDANYRSRYSANLPSATNYDVAIKMLYQNSIDQLVKLGELKEGELVLVEESGQLMLKSGTDEPIQSILKRVYPEAEVTQLKNVPMDKYNFAKDEVPMNRAERRAEKKRRRG